MYIVQKLDTKDHRCVQNAGKDAEKITETERQKVTDSDWYAN